MNFSRRGYIYVPSFVEAEVVLPTPQFAGIIQARAYAPSEGRVRREATFQNLITNAALNSFASGLSTSIDTMTAWAAVGTGTLAPVAGDIALQSQGATRTSTASTGNGTSGIGSNVPPYWQWWRRALRWAVGGATGTWTEVGFFSAQTGGTMFNRQLFKDEAGNPVAFPVLADEELWLDLYVRVYPPSGDVTGSVNITGSGLHDYVLRAVNVNGVAWNAYQAVVRVNTFAVTAETNALVSPTTANPIGATSSGVTYSTYVPDSFYVDNAVSFATTVSNFTTGVGSLSVLQKAGTSPSNANQNAFQIAFTPKILKTSAYTLVLNVRTSIARYTGAL